MRNLSELLCDRVQRRPEARFGMADTDTPTLSAAVAAAGALVDPITDTGAGLGKRVALIGNTSDAYLVSWLSLVLAGSEIALVNPTYPAGLLAEMLKQLSPDAVLWVGAEAEPAVAPRATHLDASEADRGALEIIGTGDRVEVIPKDSLELAGMPGLSRRPLDVAGWMHTSGTTGLPKFCEQTHEYFLRLGRFIADSMCLSAADAVLAPLPMFHINPLGYGVVGGLTGGSNVLGATRFSASGFWPVVKQAGVTVLILHAPPVEILKKAATPADAAGHRVSRVFFADADFLETFEIPLGFSAYGSTEAGGLSHIWAWRCGDRPDVAEGMSRYGGRSRHEVQWMVDAHSSEILVRAERPGVLFSGYRRASGLSQPFDSEGWFATGDLGRVDANGNLVFIERQSESIRVKGEYVPISFVEQRFGAIDELDDVAVWRRASDLVDDEVILFVTCAEIPTMAIRSVRTQLPTFMRPAEVARVAELPRDAGVGKVRRRLLEEIEVLERVDLRSVAAGRERA